MTQLFNRTCSLTVFRPDGQPLDKPTGFTDKDGSLVETYANGIVIRSLRMTFQIEKSLTGDPNTCDVSAFNLNENDRALLTKQRPLTVKLEAGHDDVSRLLFLGTVKFGDSYHKGTEWETKLTLADGGRAYSNAIDSKTYRSGTPYRTIITDAVKAMGMTMPAKLANDRRLDTRIPRGETLDGLMRDELTRFLAPFGLSWSMQNQQMQILGDADVREDAARPVNARANGGAGLIGTPEYGPPDKKNGQRKLKFQCLLYPELTPGGRVIMDSESVKGIHKLLKVSHSGDTRGTEWYTTCEAKPI